MDFARKHLPDKFFLEGGVRYSLRDIICREMLVNTLIHREMTSSFRAKFMIESNRMYIENASRAFGEGLITPENMEPNPKNPIIAGFFHNIGHSDQPGSGVRNLYKYTKFYSGQEPQMIEGGVFRIVVPLDDGYSFDQGIIGGNTIDKTIAMTEETIAITIAKLSVKLTETQEKIIVEILKNPDITQAEMAQELEMSVAGIRYAIKQMKEKGILERAGSDRYGKWLIVGSMRE